MPADTRREGRLMRHRRVRKRVAGTGERPRLAVFRSLSHIYAQVIDDRAGRTVAAASDVGAKAGNKTERAKLVGKALADKAKAAGVAEVVFDRGGYRYHGRVKALADAAREAGLRF
ncbi:MAG TPA: 50S ribosomal protein L18 [Gemmatimonadaceae bacterium]|nr:MAG: 50S ribosomal protein L18 [Chloroflexi bacterium RIFCSPLOWO2_02_FULL_71_16]